MSTHGARILCNVECIDDFVRTCMSCIFPSLSLLSLLLCVCGVFLSGGRSVHLSGALVLGRGSFEGVRGDRLVSCCWHCWHKLQIRAELQSTSNWHCAQSVHCACNPLFRLARRCKDEQNEWHR